MVAAKRKKPAAKKAPPRKRPASKVTPISAAPSAASRPTRTTIGYGPAQTREMNFDRTAASRSPARPRKDLDAASPSGRRPRAILTSPGIPAAASDYFANTVKDGVEFLTSGCTLIDCAVGGGWAMGRVVNIVGDNSAGKTLLAIEACANFDRAYPDGYMRYAEAEAAFDQKYAEALGLPEGKVDFQGLDPDKGINTVEDFFDDMNAALDKHGRKPMLYILDSLDALSDAAEAGREIDEGSFGASKAKRMSELFRRLVRRIEESRCLLVIISQLRDKIGVTFGEKQTRSGGRALDFYASQVVWLADIGKIVKSSDGIKRVVGNDVKLRVKKNKVGLPFRECEYPVIYGYGVDDLAAGTKWLVDSGCVRRLGEMGMSAAGWQVRCANLRNKGGDAAREVRSRLDAIVREEWTRIEKKFLPASKKY